jgi:hypothetical protein
MAGRRLRDVLVFAVARPLLFVFWALVLWGTFVAIAIAWTILTRGPAAAVHATLDRTGQGALGMANLGLAILAVSVWIVVLLLARRRRQGG